MTDLIERSVLRPDTEPRESSPAPTELAWSFGSTSKRHRLGLWAGIAAAVLVIAGGAVAVSTVLIAPGTKVAGVDVGAMTPGSAAEKIRTAIAETEITFAGTGVTVTGADLGASVDAAALSAQALEQHPMLNLGGWNPDPIDAVVTLDAATAEGALREALPSAWVAPVDATVVFDAAAESFVITPGATGTGIDLEALGSALTAALASGQTTLSFDPTPIPLAPAISDEAAMAMQATANDMLATGGFYVEGTRAVPLDAATLAGWFSIVADGDALALQPDDEAIFESALAAPQLAAVEPIADRVVVDSAGKELATIGGGVAGRTVLDEPQAIAEEIAGQVALGSAVVHLDVAEVAYSTEELVRRIDVDLSKQMLYMIENDEVVDSWRISSGKSATPTKTGTYRVGWKTSKQNMGREDTTIAPYYFQPNVKWVMYFNGNQAFHGVYWHSNWGHRMSHGCVGMPEWRAKQLYEWSPQGVDISIFK